MELIQKALQERGTEGSFYHTYADGQVSGYLFLSPAQHRYLSEKYPDILETDEEPEEE